MGWFYGFKLHMIINQLGEIINIAFTSGNVHDVKMLDVLSKGLSGILLADKGYIAKFLNIYYTRKHGIFKRF